MAYLMPKVAARGETPEGGRSTEEGSHGHTTDPHGDGGRPRRPGVRLHRAHAPDPGPLTELYPAAARRRDRARQHCLIEIDSAGVWVQDLGSLNGTHINGTKIGQRDAALHDDHTMMQPPRQGLRDGDEFRICSNVFHVAVRDSAQP